jgi:hypothetical protein
VCLHHAQPVLYYAKTILLGMFLYRVTYIANAHTYYRFSTPRSKHSLVTRISFCGSLYLANGKGISRIAKVFI